MLLPVDHFDSPDPARNPHRDTRAWSKSAVRAILDNPRYTGHQVWNRQHKHESLLDVHDVGLGCTTKLRWNSQDKWIISKGIVHTPLVDDDTFARVHDFFRSRARTGPAHGIQHPRNIYLREAWVIGPLDDWLTKVFLPHRVEETIDLMASATAAPDEPSIDPGTAARAFIVECDSKLAAHRAALEAGADPVLVTQWLCETQARRAQAETELRADSRKRRAVTDREEVARLVRSVGDLSKVIPQADPADKAELYKRLGIRLRYDPAQQKVLVEMHLDQHSTSTRGVPVRVRGGT
ncbi:recombinase family protein [Streptomyces iconiensis]|uniref:Recombinase family protein n=1 Tax=Streptomyces iconiensis TaxID=1384038 RepID=A0ABT6ZZL9_9ACTN|nr:recombinase family protein [Streptomyces iconiensis]MDJ1134524.1 recombinase family protein [Streptomyces iconiensis]